MIESPKSSDVVDLSKVLHFQIAELKDNDERKVCEDKDHIFRLSSEQFARHLRERVLCRICIPTYRSAPARGPCCRSRR
jgi:hypothetical protein